MTDLFAIHPIIGEVTSTSAVVFLVTYETADLKLTVKRDHLVKVIALQPTRVLITDLSPDQRYSLRVFYNDENVHTQSISTYAPKKLARPILSGNICAINK
jgi:hypothetical protein